MLSSYPLLESLTLLHATRPPQDDEAHQPAQGSGEPPVDPDQSINMPHLVELHLGGHPRDLTTLWRSIAIPRTASVRFDFTLSLAEPGILITQLMHAVKVHLESPRNDTVMLRARTSQWNFIEGIIGPARVDLPGTEVAQVPGTCVFNIRFGLPIMLAGQAFAYTLSAFVLAAAPHARTLRLVGYSLGPEPLDFGSSSIRTLYVQGSDALQTAAVILRSGQLSELQSAELVTEGDVMGLGGDLIEALQSRVPPLKRLVLRGAVRYLDHQERNEELELIRDAVDVLDDQREVRFTGAMHENPYADVSTTVGGRGRRKQRKGA
ncbi:hypothetical protein PENSPDRAFT_649954 [Peniophora sp. CONT]|nr:hypothetical protein PENSPDRAFT_649954 [Peniophora sp. CONT]